MFAPCADRKDVPGEAATLLTDTDRLEPVKEARMADLSANTRFLRAQCLSDGKVPSEVIREAIHYDPDTGTLTWKRRPSSHFSAAGVMKAWNTRHAGTPALAAFNREGYRRGAINSVQFGAHRVCWLLHYGEWPAGLIDHVNGDRADNRIANLRVVDDLNNSRNKAAPSKPNLAGAQGVQKRPAGFRPFIGDGSKTVYLGTYKTLDEAVAVRKRAEARLGYHPNHGRAVQ
tara:strand:+ start:344 stop:1033 length:690 start_codon:yes stop_codon:yes gene_type:complete